MIFLIILIYLINFKISIYLKINMVDNLKILLINKLIENSIT
jgi:hypothetical protein